MVAYPQVVASGGLRARPAPKRFSTAAVECLSLDSGTAPLYSWLNSHQLPQIKILDPSWSFIRFHIVSKVFPQKILRGLEDC